MDPRALLLRTAFHHVINQPTPEAGFERFSALTGNALDYNLFQDTVADCIASGLVKEPVRLTDGALHCHWHLELTADGVAAARSLVGGPAGQF